MVSPNTNSCFYLLKGGGLCEKARVGVWQPLASRRKVPKCGLKYTYWSSPHSALLPPSLHPESQPGLRTRLSAYQGWRGREQGPEVSSVGRRSPDLILTLIHSHTHTRALSSTDLFSHLLASDMRVVISTWHTRCVFLCVCLAVSLEDIHKVY